MGTKMARVLLLAAMTTALGLAALATTVSADTGGPGITAGSCFAHLR